MKEKNHIAEADRLARENAMEESQKQGLVDMHQVNKLLRQQVAHWQAEVRRKPIEPIVPTSVHFNLVLCISVQQFAKQSRTTRKGYEGALGESQASPV